MSGTRTRVQDEPAFVLHRYDWSESSLILEVFTRHHGRFALAAKGVKRPSSYFRPVLLVLQPLRLGFVGAAGEGQEIRTLKAAEWAGGHVMPSGRALFAGYYLNELLLRLLGRDDAHPDLFDVYAQAVRALAKASEHPGPRLEASAVRAFELVLLRQLGVLPQLHCASANQTDLLPLAHYRLSAQAGLAPSGADDHQALPGTSWALLELALCSENPFEQLLALDTTLLRKLKPSLGELLHYHGGGVGFRTRQLMMELQQR